MAFSGTNLTCIRGERMVFAGLDFQVEPGLPVVLEGRNGSGKSSLLRMAAMLLPIAEGTISWAGESIGEDPDAHRTRSHYVGHLDAIKPVFTVEENLQFWADVNGAGNSVDLALERFALDDLAEVPARFLSAGQKRRLNLARILASPAPLWLLDEPTNSLDQATARTVAEVIDEHCAAGGLVMVATHLDLGLAKSEVLRLDEAAL